MSDINSTDRTAALERNVGRYQTYMAFAFTPIMLPVIVLFWQANGLDMFDVFLLQSIFAVSIVILEIPTGMVADVIGKKTSLVMAAGVVSTGFLVYALASSFAGFLVAELLLGLGLSLYSGAGSALLYDTLEVLDRTSEFQRLEGRTRAIQMMAFAFCNLVGGWVGSYDYRTTIWLSLIGPVASLFLALRLIEAQPVVRGGRVGAVESYRRLTVDSIRFIAKHRLVRWQILFLGVLTGSGSWLLWMYQPYMLLSGLPIWAFGVAFTFFNLFAAGASGYAHSVDERFGRSGTIRLLIVLQILPLLLMSQFIAIWSFLFILGHQAVRALALPIFSERILRYTYADKTGDGAFCCVDVRPVVFRHDRPFHRRRLGVGGNAGELIDAGGYPDRSSHGPLRDVSPDSLEVLCGQRGDRIPSLTNGPTETKGIHRSVLGVQHVTRRRDRMSLRTSSSESPRRTSIKHERFRVLFRREDIRGACCWSWRGSAFSASTRISSSHSFS